MRIVVAEPPAGVASASVELGAAVLDFVTVVVSVRSSRGSSNVNVLSDA
ncbi:MAG: hypothetical protein MSC30_15250 [Gaiellaceae bacterium MAG52_C11]|nr:hypothetical protein [Candidatus Gaiellasilicea maunaloa]